MTKILLYSRIQKDEKEEVTATITFKNYKEKLSRVYLMLYKPSF